MGRRPGPGIWGPYEDDSGWFLRQRTTDGGVARVPVQSKASGQRIKDEVIRRWETGGRTIRGGLEEYRSYLRDEKRNKPKSYNETLRRLYQFFADVLDAPLTTMTPMRAKGLYEALTKKKATAPVAAGEDEKVPVGGKRVETEKPLAVDTCRNTVIEARTFFRYAVDQRWMPSNPLEGVKGKGKRKHGKAQPRIDEARAWLDTALAMGPKKPGAVAALCTLLLGMRATEITTRAVRDLDDGGRLLWIPDSKTEAGRRTLEVPDVLQPLLIAIAEGKASTDLLFGGSRDEDGVEHPHGRNWPRAWVGRICKAAKVPRVSAHGMRGAASTIATEGGAAGHLIAAQLGHGSETVSETSYTRPGTRDRVDRRKGLRILTGGRRS
jgi:integrase